VTRDSAAFSLASGLWLLAFEDELIALDVRFPESSLTRESCSALLLLLLLGFPPVAAWFATVRGSDLFAAAIACCHTAPIGNLGMRTQATRHFDCTGNLHGVLRAAFIDADGDS
jgi:hypothetical protein